MLLINNFTVEPDWRGTGYPAFIAARTLEIFAHMGVQAAALHATPIPQNGTRLAEADRKRVATKIATMWRKVGFKAIKGSPGYMAMELDGNATSETVEALANRYNLPSNAREF